MLSHIVVFWLKEDLSGAQRSAFREGLESLKSIESARGVYIGAPAGTGDRPVIDKSYSLALTVLFDTIRDHDAYQVHPLHQTFLKNFGSFWSRVLIYDYE
ncbi:MAG: Dabb family protein [Pseudomonadota bacterium]